MRYNGSFNYRSVNATTPTIDPNTGFMVQGGDGPYERGCECQIDKSIPARQIVGTDGQVYAYTYDVFLPKYFKGTLSIGDSVQLLNRDGDVMDEFTIAGIDNQNRKYIEIWG